MKSKYGVIERQQAFCEYGGFVMLLYTSQGEEIKENVSLLRVLQTPLLPTLAWNDKRMGQALAIVDGNWCIVGTSGDYCI